MDELRQLLPALAQDPQRIRQLTEEYRAREIRAAERVERLFRNLDTHTRPCDWVRNEDGDHRYFNAEEALVNMSPATIRRARTRMVTRQMASNASARARRFAPYGVTNIPLEDECPVCLEPLFATDQCYRPYRCGHLYHWGTCASHHRCTLCRAPRDD